MMGESWPIVVVFSRTQDLGIDLDIDLNEIFGTALGEFIASNQQEHTKQLMTLQWKTKREIMSFPFVPVSPSINRNMQHTQSESAKSIPALLWGSCSIVFDPEATCTSITIRIYHILWHNGQFKCCCQQAVLFFFGFWPKTTSQQWAK